jgi:SAM-dependent methyltransferase
MNITNPTKHYGPAWWSQHEYWNAFYKEELEDEWAELGQVRRSQYFEKFVRRYGLQPPLDILYAGCGISLIGEFMAHMGHHVTAIDLSDVAINHRKEAKDADTLVWRCAEWRLVYPYIPEHMRRKPRDEQYAFVKAEFNKLYQDGGRIRYEVMDWNDPGIPDDSYDLIMNTNGLRRATPEDTRKALLSFFRILRPGGLLITSTVNALERRDEIIPELVSAGFSVEDEFIGEDEEVKGRKLRPDRKYAVYCEMTG